ncbi:hypothetical protein OAK65_03675 [Synechococcus sp. AH-551-N17]|nr:hypothetical protein [Synechococcus sp. AH-551-N17]
MGTTDKRLAMERWPEAYQQLQEELKLRLQTPITEHHLIRARLDAGYASEMETPEGIEMPTLRDRAELILNVKELDPTNALHEQVYESLETGKFVSWYDLLDNHIQVKERKTGKPPAPSTISKTKGLIKILSPLCQYPTQLTKDLVKLMVKQLEDEGKQPVTISSNLGLIQALIGTGIRSDLLPYEVNPFSLVDFSGVTPDGGGRKELNREQILKCFGAKDKELFRLMIGTGLRVGELISRNYDQDLQRCAGAHQGKMIVIRDNPLIGWTTKTKSSVRRVPLDDRSIAALGELYSRKIARRTSKDHLNFQMREMFPDDRRLVVHSCRHTYKTICRVVGMPHEISDAISGHLKQTVSATSDGYGSYPDELLLKENQKVWDYLNELEGV